MNKKHPSILSLNFGCILMWMMFLNLVFSSYSSAQRSLIKIKCFNNSYLIKASKTAIKISLKDLEGVSRDFIDSATKRGLYLRNLGLVEYERVNRLEFRPYWKAVRIINAYYFTSMINLLPVAVYESYTNMQYSSFGLGVWLYGIPFWAGIVPGAYNFFLYELKPSIVLYKIDESNFEMVKERY